MRLQPVHLLPFLIFSLISLGGSPAEAKKKPKRRPAAAATATSSAPEAASPATPPEANAPAASPSASSSGFLFDRAENGTVYFKVPSGSNAASMVKTDLFDLNSLGAIRSAEGGLPYFVFTGRACQDCIQDRYVYLIRPSQEKPAQLVHPGKILDSRSRELLFESRAFFGRCLKNSPGDVFVVFQKERVDRRHKLQNSVFIAEPFPDRLSEKLLERGLPRLDHTLQAVRRKQCREIDGRYRIMVKKPLDLRSRAKRAADEAEEAAGDDEDDSPTKENQTDAELPASTE